MTIWRDVIVRVVTLLASFPVRVFGLPSSNLMAVGQLAIAPAGFVRLLHTACVLSKIPTRGITRRDKFFEIGRKV